MDALPMYIVCTICMPGALGGQGGSRIPWNQRCPVPTEHHEAILGLYMHL